LFFIQEVLAHRIPKLNSKNWNQK